MVKVTPAGMKRIAKAEAENLCVACLQPLDDTRTIRGCHERCLRATFREIENGNLKEGDCLKEGKILEAGRGGRKPSNPVTIEART